ncbi:hypothetical protein [Nocardiopsis sp. CNT312]|uniref:hypothetical protein n=1 Tax=Nocardiopsis sp. CNT312 TaxID=1137268 RepID=UPI0012DD9F74|nr:hypothetical protein [Nocardiopsis sp. CNT312]
MERVRGALAHPRATGTVHRALSVRSTCDRPPPHGVDLHHTPGVPDGGVLPE